MPSTPSPDSSVRRAKAGELAAASAHLNPGVPLATQDTRQSALPQRIAFLSNPHLRALSYPCPTPLPFPFASADSQLLLLLLGDILPKKSTLLEPSTTGQSPSSSTKKATSFRRLSSSKSPPTRSTTRCVSHSRFYFACSFPFSLAQADCRLVELNECLRRLSCEPAETLFSSALGP